MVEPFEAQHLAKLPKNIADEFIATSTALKYQKRLAKHVYCHITG